MISLQNFGVPRWIHESDNKKMYMLLLLVPNPCRSTTWNVKQRLQGMIKWNNWKLIFTCSEVLRLSPSKITNNSTGIYYKHYVRRVVFLPIIFFIFESHTLRASFTIMTPENTWHFPMKLRYNEQMSQNHGWQYLTQMFYSQFEKWLSLTN